MITPPPELVQQWLNEPDGIFANPLATQAARWGADQELEACCEWMAKRYGEESQAMGLLRAARRPKPPTLNSIALQMLGTIERDAHYLPEITDTIRKALEQLND
jgi:hypothetical protein